MRTSLIRIKQLSYTYPGKVRPVLTDINLEVQPGQSILITGPSGGGKSSLLRIMAGLIPRFYGGTLAGRVELLGKELPGWSHRDLAQKTALLFQDPESQIVTTRVDQEIVFGMENIGLDRSVMRQRLHQVCLATGMGPWLNRPTPHLSGGWKQRTVLASIMAVRPCVLLLDEPLSQMEAGAIDPLFDYLETCRRSWGMAVVVAEHRLRPVLNRMDQVLAIDEGRMASLNTEAISDKNETEPDRTSVGLEGDRPTLAELDQVEFSYQPRRPVLNQLSLPLKQGILTALMGENGAGKTTVLKLLMGSLRPQGGKVRVKGQDPTRFSPRRLAACMGYLSQEPGDYLFSPTVRKEIEFTCQTLNRESTGLVDALLEQFHLQKLAARNPRDLSWGERQRTALASVLAGRPEILLLDEPTRGLDARLKNELGQLLRQIAAQGTAILVVTHDREFAVRFADHILHLQSGRVL